MSKKVTITLSILLAASGLVTLMLWNADDNSFWVEFLCGVIPAASVTAVSGGIHLHSTAKESRMSRDTALEAASVKQLN